MKAEQIKNILVFLLAFLGLGAIGGGAVLIISPAGKLMGMPDSILEKSPFNSFLIPGIILFIVLGVAPCLSAFALLKKRPVNSQKSSIFFPICIGHGLTAFTPHLH